MTAGHGNEILIKDAMVFLFAAGVAVPIFRFAKLPAVIGFMVSGIALGPFALGALSERWPVLEYISISEPEAAAPFGELGVLFLLFLLGLEFSFERLWGLRKTVFGVGGLQALLSTIALALLAYWTIAPDPGLAAVIGLALALSSTAIVMQVLVDKKIAATPVGQTSFGVLLFQDILVAPILIFVGLLNMNEGASLAGVLLEALIQGLIAIAVIFFIGKFLLRRMFKMVATAGGRDFMMALTLLTVVGAAAITASAGLSLALGAFLAGLLLGETEFKHQTEVDLEPFKGILLGLFFMTVGMGLDLPAILSQPGFILGGLFALLSIKLIAAFVAVRIFNKSNGLAIESAAFLAPAGEFAFVVTAAAGATGILSSELSAPLAAIAGLSMLLIPVLSQLGAKLASMTTKEDEPIALEEDMSELKGHVLLAGYGRVGQVVSRILVQESVEIIALDRNAQLVSHARDSGLRAYLGDASRPELLHSVGLEGASSFIVTVDNPAIVEAMVKSVRSVRPDIPILARAHDPGHASILETAGANYVVPEVIETGLQLSGEVLHRFGYDSETVRNLLAADRDEQYHRATSEDA